MGTVWGWGSRAILPGSLWRHQGERLITGVTGSSKEVLVTWGGLFSTSVSGSKDNDEDHPASSSHHS